MIERGGQRIDIRPRPLLFTGLGILLVGAVARLDERTHRLRTRDDGFAGRAEIDQHRHAIASDDNVVGRHVAMEVVGLVNELERVEQRLDDGVELGLSRRPTQALQPALEALPFLELQHHVAGAVGAEVVVNPDNVGMVELGQRLGFVDKPIKSPLEIAGAVGRTRRTVNAIGASGKVRREVFLDGDRTRQRDLLGQIGHAEPARTKHALDAESAGQDGAWRKRDQIGHVLPGQPDSLKAVIAGLPSDCGSVAGRTMPRALQPPN